MTYVGHKGMQTTHDGPEIDMTTGGSLSKTPSASKPQEALAVSTFVETAAPDAETKVCAIGVGQWKFDPRIKIIMEAGLTEGSGMAIQKWTFGVTVALDQTGLVLG